MLIQIDELNRIYMTDEQSPSESIVFDLYDDYVAVYQDSDTPDVRTAFETIDSATQFEVDELISGLKEVVEILESKAWIRSKGVIG